MHTPGNGSGAQGETSSDREGMSKKAAALVR